ncbi:MAG: PIN domain-containing protein [Terrimicrobiaceae bacterium]
MNSNEPLRKAVSASTPPIDKNVLVDTTIVVNHFRTTNESLKSHVAAGGTIFLPLTVLGELYAGACRVARKEKALQQIEAFLLSSTLLLPDEGTAKTYGEIYAELALAGTPIPQNDMWIAALAKEHGLPLAAQDAHFRQIKNLTVLSW